MAKGVVLGQTPSSYSDVSAIVQEYPTAVNVNAGDICNIVDGKATTVSKYYPEDNNVTLTTAQNFAGLIQAPNGSLYRIPSNVINNSNNSEFTRISVGNNGKLETIEYKLVTNLNGSVPYKKACFLDNETLVLINIGTAENNSKAHFKATILHLNHSTKEISKTKDYEGTTSISYTGTNSGIVSDFCSDCMTALCLYCDSNRNSYGIKAKLNIDSGWTIEPSFKFTINAQNTSTSPSRVIVMDNDTALCQSWYATTREIEPVVLKYSDKTLTGTRIQTTNYSVGGDLIRLNSTMAVQKFMGGASSSYQGQNVALYQISGKSVQITNLFNYSANPFGGFTLGARVIHNKAYITNCLHNTATVSVISVKSIDLSTKAQTDIIVNQQIDKKSVGVFQNDENSFYFVSGTNVQNAPNVALYYTEGGKIQQGVKKYSSNQAIALNSASIGQNVKLIFDGIIKSDLQDGVMSISDDGVAGKVIGDKLSVFPEWARKLSSGGVKIETGSYKGTNLASQQITFYFKPYFVIVSGNNKDSYNSYPATIIFNIGEEFVVSTGLKPGTGNTYPVDGRMSNMTLSWSVSGSNNVQNALNMTNNNYYYIAIG